MRKLTGVLAVALLVLSCSQVREFPKPRASARGSSTTDQPTLDQLKSRADELLTQIASTDYKTREKATRTLRRLIRESGNKQETLLAHIKSQHEQSEDIEMRLRVEKVLDQCRRPWHYFEKLHTLKGHREPITAMAFSPGGKFLASGSEDQAARIWDIHTGDCLHILKGHKNSVLSVSYSPLGNLLATASSDNTVRIWDVDKGKCLHVLKGHSKGLNCAIFSPDGTLLASASTEIRIWDPKTGQRLHVIEGHETFVWSLEFSPDGSMLVSGSFDGAILLWNPKTGKLLHSLKEHRKPVSSMSFSPNSKLLASGSWFEIRLWDLGSGKHLRILQTEYGPSDYVHSLKFSADGSTLTSASDSVRLWNARAGKCIHRLEESRYNVSSIDYSPDGTLLASAGSDEMVYLWDPQEGKKLRVLKAHTDYVRIVAFSPDNELLASGSDDKSIIIWGIPEK